MPKKRNSSKLITNEVVVKKGVITNRAPLLDVNISVTNLKNAKRFMSKLISNFVSGRIINQDAKDLSYLVTVFIMACREADIEERIKKLEEKVK